MKRTSFGVVVLLLGLILFISGCHNGKKGIVDWEGFAVTEDMVEITASDLNAAMDMYAYAAEDDIESANQLTDQIVQRNYGIETVAELKALAVDEIVRHRIYDAVLQFIWDSATVDILSTRAYQSAYQSYITRVSQCNDAFASQEGLNTDEYIAEAYQMTPEEYVQYEESRFAEYYLLRSILEQEGITISPARTEEALAMLAIEEDMTAEEARVAFLEEDIASIIVSDMFYEFVIDRYQSEINQACSDMKARFGLS